ncbi:MAG: acylneuraminate cytidylyltransferase family protein [Planctomycetes bacterium]|nr:acylneuraminate cytidylyltransferase family protein [Planctomycetota bacterium]
MNQPEQTPRPRILGLIPARSGSKGVPNKNIRLLGGQPLLHYACQCGLESHHITRTIVSTDCPEIARVARSAGAETPFLRPKDLARDDSPTLDLVRHALDWLEQHEGESPEIVVLLQPTAPLRRAEHVDEALEKLLAADADSVVSVRAVESHFHPRWQFTIEGGELHVYTGEPLVELVPRRQLLSPTYVRNGAIYAFRPRSLEATGSIYGRRCLAYEMSAELSLNIDTLDDWREAAAHFARAA